MAARTSTVALVSLLLALTFASSAGADPLHVPLTRRSRSHPVQDLHEQANRLLLKYGLPTRPVKSNTSSNTDNDYFASLNIGSPPQTLNVILDTGSSDLWVAGTACTVELGCDPSALLFQSSKSTSFQGDTGTSNSGLGNPMKINYGSGSVTGSTSEDTVTMGGFTISNQVFCNITDSDVSGLMGWHLSDLPRPLRCPSGRRWCRTTSSPHRRCHFIWHVRPTQTKLMYPEARSHSEGQTPRFYRRHRVLERINKPAKCPHVLDFTSDERDFKWKIHTISLYPGNGALDTGTTLITGSSETLHHNTRCRLFVRRQVLAINEEDINLGQDPDEPSKCVGAIFDGGLPSDGSLSWIIGDTFLYFAQALLPWIGTIVKSSWRFRFRFEFEFRFRFRFR
ncbi:aspartic peptidase domain-containing protein [Pholiota molesta]|nr:aspartic peptidase domain-containing protein [Pholiota molesta]